MGDAVRGVKLLLDRSKEIRYGPAIESDEMIKRMSKEPVDVAGQYLKKIVSHGQRILDRRGIGGLMKTMDVQYILTVPAVWSDKAKDLTLQAAYHAGISRSHLSLLSEPEAAAVYTIRTIHPNSIAVCAFSLALSPMANKSQKGDCFIVCDAGGGTVVSILCQSEWLVHQLTVPLEQIGPYYLSHYADRADSDGGSG